MPERKHRSAKASSELETRQSGPCVLRLYVAGGSVLSLRAVAHVTALCEKHCGNGFDLEVIDIRRMPERAGPAGIVATPTLIRLSPGPHRILVGDLSDEERVLRGLDLRSKPM